MNIQKRILLWFLIPSVLMTTTVAAFYYFYTRRTLEQNIFDQLETTVVALDENVHTFLEAKRGRAIDFSSDGFIRDTTEEITMPGRRLKYYTSTLDDHLITNKKSLDPGIHEVLVVDFEDKIIASTDEGRIGEVVSTERFYTGKIFSGALVGDSYYDTRLKTFLIDFSAVLLTKTNREPIGFIINRIKIEQSGDRIRDGKSAVPARIGPGGQDTEKDYSNLIATNKTRIIDFSSDGLIREYTEKIVRTGEKAFYYADLLNTHLYANKQPLDPDILSVFVVNLDGAVVSSTEPGQIGRDVSGEAYFTKALKRSSYSYIGDLRHPQGLRQNAFFDVACLLLNKQNQDPIGVIVNRYSGEFFEKAAHGKLSEMVMKAEPRKELGETGETYIVNSNKLMITGSRFIKGAVFKQVVDTDGVRAAFENGRGMTGIYPDYRGVPVIGASRYLEELDWVILAEKDVSEAFAPLVYLRNITVIMGFAGIIVLAAIAIFISKGITRPIRKLVKSADTIANGNLTEIIRIKSKDEIGSLSSSFDTMRLGLDKRVKHLQKLSELSMTLSGDPIDIFKSVAQMIGELFNVPVVCLLEIRGDELDFLSVYDKGTVATNAGSCPINITPCATVRETKDMRIYQNVLEKFPKASFLKTYNAFSYCGFPSLDSVGKVISVTCLLDYKPREYSNEEKNLLEIFAQRIGVEMERKQYLAEHRRTEEALKKSEAGLSRAQHIAHLGGWNWEIVKNELFWSDEVYRIFGQKPQEFVVTYEAFLNFVHTDDREFVNKSVNDALCENKPYNIDHRIVLPDGSVRIVNEQAEVVFDSTGMAIQMNGTVQDITERKLIEEGLRTRERQQAAISELGMHALEDPDIDTLLNEAVSITALALGVEYCKILELLPDGKALLLKAGVGWKTGSVGCVTVGADNASQVGYTLISGKPVIVDDMRTETRFSAPPLLLDHSVVSGMSVVIKSKNYVYGVIGVHTPRRRTFTGDDANFLQAIAIMIADVTERKKLSAHIDHIASYDALTDLPNRILFIDRVTRTISRSKREKEQIAVLYLNLDRFKVINDSMGNETGDRLLKSVAERIVNCVREGDTVSRMGSDEFAIMLGGITSAPDITKVSQKIIEAVSKPFVLDVREMHITASIGISMYPQDDEETEGLIKKASAAMLQAKEHGRNNDRFYNTEMETASYEMMMLENDLRKALDRKEFLLYYQPQVDINTGRIIGVEALVRWMHPDRGMVSPAEFIPLAEETGLIIPIGEWVLHTALAQNKAWQEEGLAPVKISVNFSSVQFRQKDPVELVANALRETGLDPGYMELEITESVIMKGADAAIKKFQELKGLGIHICMDDFGTGYSSLSYLKRFPIDILKIDQSFARNVTTDTNDASIVTATIAMAHGLGLKVIAEGVETREQLEFFRSHKCEVIQGYLFSKPLPAEDITKLLRKGKLDPS
jgi:diguanylate cyclase (GGDEF)-like protein/PAS domain S-box-containing protein